MKRSQQGVQSVEVAGRLLRVLVSEGKAMMLRDLAKLARMPAAKAHRYLVSLSRLGLIAQDVQTSRYDLANFALELGLARQSRMDAIGLATAALEELRDSTGESVLLAIWGDPGPTVIRVLESRRLSFVMTRAGRVMPLTWSATGLAFLAFLPEAVTHSLVATELESNRRRAGSKAPKSKKELDALLVAVRHHGLSCIHGTVTPAINALGAPVFDYQGAIVAVVTLIGSSGDLDVSWDGPVVRALRNAADSVSRKLGYVPRQSDNA